MKLIRQSEVYLIEEAVTDQIVKTTQQQIDQTENSIMKHQQEDPAIANLAVQIGEVGLAKDEGIVDIQT